MSDRQELLIKLISQLQADHDLAVKSGNVGAAVTASRAIADLLSVKDETAKPEPNPLDKLSYAELDGMIQALTASLRADGHGYLFGDDKTEAPSAESFPPRRDVNDALAARVLALLDTKPQNASEDTQP